MRFRQFYSFLFLIFAGSFFEAHGQVKITVYNNNLALVTDLRTMTVPSGVNQMEFPDVAGRIIPASVLINVKDAPESFKIFEQNFEFDLIGSAKIYDKYLDNNIILDTEHSGRINGKLLSRSGADVVLQLESGQIMLVNAKEILSTRFDELPDGLRTRPTLLWDIDNSGDTSRKLEVSYLTEGISWGAQYVGLLSADEQNLELSGWISVDNRSGKSYENAVLKLVAGDVNRQQISRREKLAVRALLSSASTHVEEKQFFEYHLYSVARKTNVKNNQKKQIQFIAPVVVKTQKEYIYNGSENPRNVSVTLSFDNKKSAGIGIPLPAGLARVYKADTDGGKIYLGEDRIKHTPKNEDVRLKIGNAFDIVGDRKELYNNKLSKRSNERAFEIELRNHKHKSVRITIIERFNGDWRITESSIPVQLKTADKAKWLMEIPAESKRTLNFVIRSQW